MFGGTGASSKETFQMSIIKKETMFNENILGDIPTGGF